MGEDKDLWGLGRVLGSRGGFLGLGSVLWDQGCFFWGRGQFFGIRVGPWGRGHHRPSLQVVPKVRQLRVLRGLLSSLPLRPVRGHLGVLQGPEDEEEKGSQGAFIPPDPPGDKSHKSESPSCPPPVPAGAGLRRAPLMVVNEARGECPQGGAMSPRGDTRTLRPLSHCPPGHRPPAGGGRCPSRGLVRGTAH